MRRSHRNQCKSSRHVTLTAASLCNVGYILEDLYHSNI